MKRNVLLSGVGLAMVVLGVFCVQAAETNQAGWKVGMPIVTYWAGPEMTDATATQMKEGNWNLVWCTEKELDTVLRHGLRGQLTDPLLAPDSLNDPARKAQLAALIDRVSRHPALYSYFITDEPCSTNFPALGAIMAFLREKDPGHMAYINLFPTYASNEQLGNKGDGSEAYRAHLRGFIDTVKPALLSYDHYQFAVAGDNPDYFLNLALMREAALKARLPFLNIVQACTWTPSMRVPGGDEMRYLVYTTLAYGAQGISYYVYCHPGHTGAIANADGTPTALYPVLKDLNREFVAIARELQPLQSLGVYHAGMLPPGAVPFPKSATFTLDPPPAAQPFAPPAPARGILLGEFGDSTRAKATHAVVVNVDYKAAAATVVKGPGKIQVFNTTTGQWEAPVRGSIKLELPAGGGRLIRLAK
jgi:hypothetical protein